MNFKKLLALMLAAVMVLCVFTACGDETEEPKNEGETDGQNQTAGDEESSEEPLPMLQIDGKEVDTDGLVVMTIDGIEVPFDEYRYTYKYLDSYYFSGGSDNYWDDFPDQFAELKKLVEGQLLENHWGVMLAEKYDVEMTDEDKEVVENALQEQRDMFETPEDFESALEESAISEDLLKRMIEQQQICNRVYEELYSKDGAPLAPSEEECKEILDDDFVRVYHVLISNDHFADDEEYADADDETLKAAAKEYAEQLLEEIQNGADIYELAQEADDPGMIDNPDGYFFTTGEMVQEFEDASFALEVGGLSGLVESSYGFHIIQRLEQEQYINDHYDEVRMNAVNKVFNQDVDDMLANAQVEYWEDYDKIVAGSIH